MINFDELVITNVFTKEDYKKDGYRLCRTVYFLYDDQTWEEVLVFDGDYIETPVNAKLGIANRIKRGRTRAEAIAIIEKLIDDQKLIGRLKI